MITIKRLKFYSKSVGIFYLSLFILLLITGLLNYTGIFSYRVTSIINYVLTIVLFLILGIYAGKNSEKKGFINGLYMGLVITVTLLFFSLITTSFPKLESLIYFAILNSTSVLGGMIGINHKNKNS